MPRCPFATWKPISGSSGTYTGGPFKIVHHTTEGSTAEGAFSAFRSHRSDPHFTVDATKIYQHIDTNEGARALRNPAGGVETNRDSAVQIEVVGFAHRAKTRATLDNVRRLCRWLESTHGIPKVWPNGPPKPAVNGRDPGGHNRNAATWDRKGGHYGHSNVPENTHWDPGYTAAEVDFLMLDDTEGMENLEAFSSIITEDPGLESDHSRMPDHAEPNGPATEGPAPKPRRSRAKPELPKAKPEAKKAAVPKTKAKAETTKTEAETAKVEAKVKKVAAKASSKDEAKVADKDKKKKSKAEKAAKAEAKTEAKTARKAAKAVAKAPPKKSSAKKPAGKTKSPKPDKG